MGRKPYKNRDDVRLDCFAMRVNVQERRMLEVLAERLQRSQSDVVRLLVREAVQGLLPSADQGAHAEVQETRQCPRRN